MKVKISKLKECKYSKEIYNHEPPPDLIESIKSNGVLQAIWISEYDIIISGHRRVNACRQLGIEEIDAEIKEYSDLLVIESNRYRIKTQIELLREADSLEIILKPLARGHQIAGKKLDLCQNSDKPIDTKKEVSKAIGTSHDTLYKLKTIQKEKPELLQQIDDGKRSVHSAYKQIQREEKKEEYKKKLETPKLLSEKKKYRIIYADPPWCYGDKRDGFTTGAEDHYPAMTIQQLCAEPVENITEENAVLFLWVTSPLLEECFEVIKAWGFKYKTSFVWDKVKHNMGHYNSVRHELLLICTKGSCLPDGKKLHDSVVSIERTKHSEKPKLFYDIIESLYGYGNKIELFARAKRQGWDRWGNQA